jgi:hypothetical protein
MLLQQTHHSTLIGELQKMPLSKPSLQFCHSHAILKGAAMFRGQPPGQANTLLSSLERPHRLWRPTNGNRRVWGAGWRGQSGRGGQLVRNKWSVRSAPTLRLNPLTPNDLYMTRTAPLTSKRCILYIYSTNIGTEYLKHALYSPFFLFKMQFVS